jgi:hypothetical protein
MKRFVFTIIFLLQLVSPLKATPNKQDSLRVFLEQIGEDTTMISLIVNSPDAKEPSRIIVNYRSLLRLGYDCNREQYEWYPGWEDSLYVCKYVDYLTQQIIQDTMLYLIKDYLEEVYLFLFQDEYAVGRLLNCAEYAIEKYHSRSGYLLPELYYYNKKESIAQFSFLMVLVPILGDAFLELLGILQDDVQLGIPVLSLVVGFIAAYISGCLACKWMIQIVKRGKLIYFAAYCLIAGALAIFLA